MSIVGKLAESLTKTSSQIAQLFWPKGEPPKAANPEKLKAKASHGPVSSLYGRDSQVDAYFDYLRSATSRMERYDTYDAMDEESDVSSVLDGYAEDATQIDHDEEKVVWVEGDDQSVVDELNHMLHNQLKVDDWIEGCARDTAKAGDDFGRLVFDQNGEMGVVSIEWLNPRAVERIENRDGVLLGFEWTDCLEKYMERVHAAKEGEEVTPSLNPWDVVHFRRYIEKRLPENLTRNIYGTSVVARAEKPAKRVKIFDDLLMISRLTRAMDRHVYKIDTGNSAVEEVVRILKSWKRALKRQQYIDPTTGKFDSRFDPLSFTQDIFFPVSSNSNSTVETLPGITNISDIADMELFINKLYGSMRASKADYGYEGETDLTKTASNRSVKWAKAVVSLQKALKQGITRICQIHLAWKGMSADAEKFKVMMVSPSTLELLERLEAWQTLVDVADRMVSLGDTMGFEKRAWSDYILRNVLWLSRQEIAMLLAGMDSASAAPGGGGGLPPAMGGGEEPEPTIEPPGEPTVEPEASGEGEVAPESTQRRRGRLLNERRKKHLPATRRAKNRVHF